MSVEKPKPMTETEFHNTETFSMKQAAGVLGRSIVCLHLAAKQGRLKVTYLAKPPGRLPAGLSRRNCRKQRIAKNDLAQFAENTNRPFQFAPEPEQTEQASA